MAAGKILLGLGLLAAPGWQWLVGVQQRNAAVAQAQAAARQERWATAAAAWQTAVAQHPDPAVLANLGFAQLQAGQAAAARRSYGQLLKPGTPATLGSVARQQLALLAAAQGRYVPALGLLREALRLDPRNAVARRNYERLQTYLDAQAANKVPPPQPQPQPDSTQKPKPAPRPAPAPGGAAPSAAPKPKPTPGNAPQPQPEAPGPAGPRQPAPAQPQLGSGPATPLPTGPSSGPQRGLDTDAAPGPNPPRPRALRPGTETANPADAQLQTQRERLQALNLTPAQAHQLLETLRAQEQQYLQQVRRPAPAGPAPDPKGPTW